jgi:hypothetical protein
VSNAQSRGDLELGVWARHIDNPGTSGRVIELTAEKVRLDFTQTGGGRVWYPQRDVIIPEPLTSGEREREGSRTGRNAG